MRKKTERVPTSRNIDTQDEERHATALPPLLSLYLFLFIWNKGKETMS